MLCFLLSLINVLINTLFDYTTHFCTLMLVYLIDRVGEETPGTLLDAGLRCSILKIRPCVFKLIVRA